MNQETIISMALEALEELFHSNSTKVAVEKYNTAHNALREALDHFRDATKMVVEQAEQEPVAWIYEYGTDRGDAVNEIRWYPNLSFIKPSCLARNVRPVYAAPVSIHSESETDSSSSSMRTTIRTKDLTEEDINELWNTALMIADPTAGNLRFKFARAVIAADREKNRG